MFARRPLWQRILAGCVAALVAMAYVIALMVLVDWLFITERELIAMGVILGGILGPVVGWMTYMFWD